MNAIDLALAQEALLDSFLPEAERDTILAAIPQEKLRLGQRYLQACRWVQFQSDAVSHTIPTASEIFHISEPTLWRAWAHYTQKVDRDTPAASVDTVGHEIKSNDIAREVVCDEATLP